MPAETCIRAEEKRDCDAIRALNYEAFLHHPHHAAGSLPTEHKIVDALRDQGTLILSLVAEQRQIIVGHIAFSPVLINQQSCGWVGLGPVAVLPEYQKQGIGRLLINQGIARMREQGAAGIVLLGDPAFYRQFGFKAEPGLTLADVPPEYFLCLGFGAILPIGEVSYDAAFSTTS
ncbi:GNAT family N-acetyltransferase [Glaciimonas soli]|uniref:GNAT family N-acetyltransferase n=1 Tax=Glaciimonas soli TaxID=2590999 RepID=A0A843YM42_9BURK|nr:N-acetyltransferase [Glaciimonas soli]MQR00525.1 GNAT family N-acetyltransferase [Glaciimonas soli]